MVIRMSKIMMSHSHLSHHEKLIVVLCLLVIQSPQQPQNNNLYFIYLGNNIYVLKLNGKVPMQKNVINQEH